MTILITVISDEIEKAKEFAKHICNVEKGKPNRIIETKYDLVIEDENFLCRAVTPSQSHRGHRHHKIYVDKSMSNEYLEIFNDTYRHKTIPIYVGNTFVQLGINEPIEIIDFNEYLTQGGFK